MVKNYLRFCLSSPRVSSILQMLPSLSCFNLGDVLLQSSHPQMPPTALPLLPGIHGMHDPWKYYFTVIIFRHHVFVCFSPYRPCSLVMEFVIEISWRHLVEES